MSSPIKRAMVTLTLVAAAVAPMQVAGAGHAAPVVQARLVAGAPQRVWSYPAGEVVDARVVTDGTGISTAFWEHGPSIFAGRSRTDGTWRRPVRLGPGREPEGVVDGRGRVTVIWRALHGADLVTRRRAGGIWRPATRLTLATGARRFHIQEPYRVAVNARGDTVATWAQKNGGFAEGTAPRQLVAAFRPRNGSWSASRLSRRGRADAAFVARTGTGMVLNWSGFEPGLYVRPAGDAWQSAEPVPASGRIAGRASDPAGDIAVATVDVYGASPVTVYDKPYRESWAAGVVVGEARTSSVQVPVVLDRAGRETVAFGADDGSASVVHRRAGTGWSTVRAVSATGVEARQVRLVSLGHGVLGLSWLAGVNRARSLWAAVGRPGSPWSEPTMVTGARWTRLENVALTAEPDGSMLATWKGVRDAGSSTRIVARSLAP